MEKGILCAVSCLRVLMFRLPLFVVLGCRSFFALFWLGDRFDLWLGDRYLMIKEKGRESREKN